MAKKSFVSGAIILMLAGLVVRILGFVYRIYLSNLIGAEGMGLFQLISPVYSLIILTLTAGVSIAVSKMVAEELARNHPVNLRRITAGALAIVVAAGLIISVVILIYGRFIADVILKDSRTYYSLMLLIPCIPVIAAASVLKGYFYGVQDVTPTAISQIVEQIVRISIVMFTAGYFLNIGLEYACALATIGMAIGEISNLLVLCIIYKIRKKGKGRSLSNQGIMKKRKILGEIVRISVPVSFNRFITSIMYAVELILIPRMLLAGGLDYQRSIEEYGRLTGMALPLLLFPTIVTNSLATTLVPAISEAISLRQFKSVNYRISKSIQFSFILGFIFTTIYVVYPHQIGDLLYKNENVGSILYTLSITCIFIYLQQTLVGILNGLGKQAIYLRNSIIGYVIRIGFVYFCIPAYGIKGYMWGIIASTLILSALDLYTVVKTTGMALDFRNWLIKPGLVALVMYFISKYIYSFFTIFDFGVKFTVLLAVCGNILISLLLMVAAGALDKDDLFKVLGMKMVLRRIHKTMQ